MSGNSPETARRRAGWCRKSRPYPSMPSWLNPRHHRTKLFADLLQLVLGVAFTQRQEAGPADGVLSDPFFGELAGLDLVKDALHLLLGFFGDDARPAAIVAVLGGIGHGVAHARHAAFIDQVHDELHLVDAFEVRALGRVAGLHQRLEA